jgi:hypothetical protein
MDAIILLSIHPFHEFSALLFRVHYSIIVAQAHERLMQGTNTITLLDPIQANF